jgi:NADP-dependent aldehyde dehydrogenase
MLHGRSNDVGKALVEDARIAAVGFTGSAAGGKALCALAAARPAPIPVFAEMGSVNPVFVLPQALQQRGGAIAARIVASALQAVGQFCTSPGMVLFVDDENYTFLDTLRDQYRNAAVGTLVHPTIRAGFERAVTEVRRVPGVRGSARALGEAKSPDIETRPLLLSTSAEYVLAHARLREEIFGPALLAVACRSTDEMLAVARALHGHLTATVHAAGDDLAQHRELLAVLRGKVGRLIHDGVPTGVEVVAAMQHGGPWPASSDSRFTAVGQRAILRWVRPLCFQDAPPETLPEELRDGNPRNLWRTVDGELGRH